MNENLEKPTMQVPPLKKICMTIGQLPSSYLETMSYYEMLVWFVNYLRDDIIPVVNANGEATQELQEMFVQLQNYVNTYFDNLDLQDEVDHKIDEMVESGEFEVIVARYLNHKVDYYEITDQSETDVQGLFNLNKPKIISFLNDYTFTSTKILNRDTTLLLNGHTLTFNVPSVLDDWESSHGFFNFNSDDEYLAYEGNGNITIRNGKIIGGNISFIHGNNVTIQDIYFLHCKNNHIIELCGMNNVHIENCKFEGTPYDDSGDSNFKENIQLDNTTFANFPFLDEENPTYDNTTNNNIYIVGNIFVKPDDRNYEFYNGVGMHSYVEDYYHENIIIKNNQFLEMKNQGIVLINVKHSNIEDNTFVKTGYDADEQGSMIRYRSVIEDSFVNNNTFSGNVRAIETASPVVTYKNIIITNNTFTGYKYSDSNYAVINFYESLNNKIENNLFKDFTQNIIRSETYDSANKDVTYVHIINNIFRSENLIDDNIIKIYGGTGIICNNIFDSEDLVYTHDCVITPSQTGGFKQIIMKENSFNDTIITNNKAVYDQQESNNYKEVYGILKIGWSGSSSSLSSQSLNVAYAHFNRCLLIVGDGSHTQIQTLTAFSPISKLDARTFEFVGSNIQSENIGNCKLTLNGNGTINYTADNTPLRAIYFYNE